MSGRANSLVSSAGSIGVGLLLAGVLVACALGLMSTLNPPSPGDKLAVRAVARLDQLVGVRGSVELSGIGTIGVVCTRWHRGELIRLSDGGVFAVSSTHVRSLAGPSRLRDVLSAEADLAGCPRLVRGELIFRLESGGSMSGRAVYVDDRPTYALLLGRGRPVVELDVTRDSFTPLGLRFTSRFVHGSSDLVAIAGQRSVSRRPRD